MWSSCLVLVRKSGEGGREGGGDGWREGGKEGEVALLGVVIF